MQPIIRLFGPAAPFSVLIFLCLLRLTVQGAEREPRRFVTNASTQAVSMTVDGKTCWTYVPQSDEGKPFFHPLAIPGTGEILTSFRPPDHTWHLGFWFSWKFINGVNFWEPDSNGVTRVISQTVTPASDMEFTADCMLVYLAKGQEAVREKRTVRVTTLPNGNYTINWDSTFTARDTAAAFSSTPVKKDSQGNWATGGYAGLMLRLADSPAFTYAFKNAAGQSDVKTCGEASDRLEIVATAQASGTRARITFRDHPENPRYPAPWFARHSVTAQHGRGYYLIGPSPTFHEPFTLLPGTSARFRYTVTVERL